MKILFFSPKPLMNQEIKGSGNWIQSLIEAVHKYDNKKELSIVVAFHDTEVKQVDYSSIKDIQIARIPVPKKSSNISKLINNWTGRDIYKYVQRYYIEVVEYFKPDIVQLFGLEHPHIRVLGNIEKPVVIHIQGLLAPYNYKTKINYSRYSTTDIILSNKFSTLLKGSEIPSIKWLKEKRHLDLEESKYDKCKYFFGRTDWDRWVSKALAPNSHYYYCQEIMRSQFYEHEWSKSKNGTFVIYSTLDSSFRKNIDIAFEVVNILEKYNKNFLFEWRVAGVDNDSVIVNLMHRLGNKTDKIKLLGRLDSHDIIKEMLNSNVFVFPSAIENSPNALQEAMLVGMPVIASHAGGISSLIDKNSGILVPEGEPYSMAGAIIEIYDEFDKAKLLGKSARKIALGRNNPESVVRSLINAYNDILIDHKS